MTYLMGLGTPLSGTRIEVEELVKELDLKLTPIELFADDRFEIRLSNKFDSAKFNGVIKDICLMYVLCKDDEPEAGDMVVLAYLEYQEGRVYEDIAQALVSNMVFYNKLPHFEDATENY